jgi:hypothetical protein
MSGAELLQVWESGQGRSPVTQALLLLAAAYPDEPPQALAELPLGQRDRKLLELRRWLFGPHLESMVICPQCGERLELAFDMSEIQAPVPEGNPGGWELEHEGYHLRFRLPTSQDLLAAGRAGGPDRGRLALLEGCLLEASRGDRPQSVAELPGEVQGALIRRLSELDPQSDVDIPLTCPACAHDWTALFDIVTFFWQELNTWALRTMQEVHTLASAYAWREADILALSPWRRRAYIEMVTR